MPSRFLILHFSLHISFGFSIFPSGCCFQPPSQQTSATTSYLLSFLPTLNLHSGYLTGMKEENWVNAHTHARMCTRTHAHARNIMLYAHLYIRTYTYNCTCTKLITKPMSHPLLHSLIIAVLTAASWTDTDNNRNTHTHTPKLYLRIYCIDCHSFPKSLLHVQSHQNFKKNL